MLLNEIIQPRVPVFHLTGIHETIGILKTQSFKLTGGPHTNPDHNYADPTGRWHLSVARSTQSIFVRMMAARGSVLLTINRTLLQCNNKIVPYKCMDAEDEGWHDEMEDRVYSDSPILKIRPPINRTILSIRAIGKPFTTQGASHSFTEADVKQLTSLCQQHNIPLQWWDEENEDAFIRGR